MTRISAPHMSSCSTLAPDGGERAACGRVLRSVNRPNRRLGRSGVLFSFSVRVLFHPRPAWGSGPEVCSRDLVAARVGSPARRAKSFFGPRTRERTQTRHEARGSGRRERGTEYLRGSWIVARLIDPGRQASWAAARGPSTFAKQSAPRISISAWPTALSAARTTVIWVSTPVISRVWSRPAMVRTVRRQKSPPMLSTRTFPW